MKNTLLQDENKKRGNVSINWGGRGTHRRRR